MKAGGLALSNLIQPTISLEFCYYPYCLKESDWSLIFGLINCERSVVFLCF